MDVNRQMQYLQTKEMNFEDVVGFDKEITRLRNEQEKYLELRAGLYEDLKTGIITQTDFKNFSKIYEKQYIETEKALTRQEDMLKKLFYNGVQSGVKLERLKETMQIATLDRDTLLAFVDRIEVYEEKKVSVQFLLSGRNGKDASVVGVSFFTIRSSEGGDLNGKNIQT